MLICACCNNKSGMVADGILGLICIAAAIGCWVRFFYISSRMQQALNPGSPPLKLAVGFYLECAGFVLLYVGGAVTLVGIGWVVPAGRRALLRPSSLRLGCYDCANPFPLLSNTRTHALQFVTHPSIAVSSAPPFRCSPRQSFYSHCRLCHSAAHPLRAL